MKVYINNYRNHWISPYVILEKVFFWREIDYHEPIIEKWAKRLEPISLGLQKVLDIIHPKIDYVKIDKWDTWSMDSTLARIILPMLRQLKATSIGVPQVDNKDLPKELHKNESLEDQVKRWDYVIDEMIWAFEQVYDPKGEGEFFDDSEVDKSEDLMSQIGKLKYDEKGLRAYYKRIDNGLLLFGKYFRALWD